jgi:hypothetical protein
MKEITNKYMEKKFKPAEDENIFKVKGDGTIERIGNADLQNDNYSALDKELLDIIEINSYSKKLLAAYKARKIANKISRQKYGKPNYKEYVEMLMIKHFPKEYEKAQLGGKYLFWLWFIIIIAIISYFFLVPSIILLLTVVIPTYKKLKNISNNNESNV